MEHKCEECSKSFKSKESLEQHNNSKHSTPEKKNLPIKKIVVSFLMLAIIVGMISTFYVYSRSPGKYDDFAQCLNEEGAVMYGDDFCQFSNQQFGYFGRSKRYLNYVKCANNQELCDNKGVRTTPTWEINGEMYEGIQSFERLSEITGCGV